MKEPIEIDFHHGRWTIFYRGIMKSRHLSVSKATVEALKLKRDLSRYGAEVRIQLSDAAHLINQLEGWERNLTRK